MPRRARGRTPPSPTGWHGLGAGKGYPMTERGQSGSGAGRTGRSRREPAESPSTGSATMGSGAATTSAAAAGGSATAFGAASGAGGAGGGPASSATEAVAQIQGHAGQLVELARDQLTEQLTTQKTWAADRTWRVGRGRAPGRPADAAAGHRPVGGLRRWGRGPTGAAGDDAARARHRPTGRDGERLRAPSARALPRRRRRPRLRRRALPQEFRARARRPHPREIRLRRPLRDRSDLPGRRCPRLRPLGPRHGTGPAAGGAFGVDAVDAFGGTGRTDAGVARSEGADLGLDAEPGAARPLRVDAGFGAEDR